MKAINVVAWLGLALSVILFLIFSKYQNGNMTAVLAGKRGGKKKANEKEVLLNPQQENKIGLTIFAAILTLAFFTRVAAALYYKGNDTDMNCFLLWGDMVFKSGIGEFYHSESFHDYPPGYMYILYLIGAIRAAFHIAWDAKISILLTKMPAILADLGIGCIIYKAASEKFRKTGAAVLTAAYLFMPAIFLDGAVWGQTDAVFTFFIVWMSYLITKKKLIPSYFVFAVAILIKPQSLIFTPVLIFGIIDQVFLEDFYWEKFWKNLGLGLLAIALIPLLMAPFGFAEAFAQYKDTVGSYEFCSVNAYNFWTLCGLNWSAQSGVKLGLSYRTWGTLFIILTVIAAAIINFRSKKSESKYYFVGAFIVSMVFFFAVRMHERYLFPAMALLLLSFVVRPHKWIYALYSLLSMYEFYNMAHVLFYYDPKNYDFKNPVFFAVSAFGLAVMFLFVGLAAYYYGGFREEKFEKLALFDQNILKNSTKKAICPSEKLAKLSKRDLLCMAGITVIYAIIAFVRLGNFTAPETDYSLVTQGGIVADLGADTYVAKLNDFLGYQNNPKYYVEYSSDNVNWTPLYNTDNPWDAGSVFCWNSVDLNITARFIRITPSQDTYKDSILELAFTDADGKVITPVNAKDYKNLFDEQDLYPTRKTNLNGTYFDEIYHARTAYEMIHKLYCYENTHPPLGKILISVGVRLFGMTPFGWRFMGTLFGVLMLPILYVFSKKFFKQTWISSVTTILFAFDFMHFVQTRIATIDVFVTLFIMLSYYFMYCYSRLSFYDTKLSKTFVPLGFCGVAMGLSCASKWTGIYSAAGLAVIFFAQMIRRFMEYIYAAKNPDGTTEGIAHQDILNTFYGKLIKTLLFCCVFFIVVPGIIYLLSYIPFQDGTDRGFLEKVMEAQKTMFNYHSQLHAEHPYSSKWWQWPIMYRPMWYYSGVVSDTVREGISAFGNPLVWWMGIPATVYMLYLIFFKRDKKAAFLTVGYLSQYAPWFLVKRVVFIYHYFPSVPFITVMIGYAMYRIVKKYPKTKNAMYIYAAAAIGLFILFYPVLSGTPTTVSYAKHFLKWFDSWVLLQTW